jgi:hemolysin activation/secretion protein
MGLDYKDHLALGFPSNVFYITTVITNDFGEPVTKISTTSIPGDTSRQAVSYIPVFLGWNGSLPDRWGQTSGSISGVFSPGDSQDFTKYVSPQANGQFAIGRFRLARDQPLWKEFRLSVTAEGQIANQPLVSLEQFGIGGNASVRGYLEGELYGDNGFYTQIELKSPSVIHPVNLGDRSVNVAAGLSVFTDYGQIYLIDPQGRDPDSELWGAGVAGNLLVGAHFEARVTLGWPLMDSPLHKAGTSRVTFAIAAQF